MRPPDARPQGSGATLVAQRWLVHACAGVALSYAVRVASFARSWVDAPLLQRKPAAPLPKLSIVVPARDEERSIEPCVRSLLAQQWVDFDLIVVDDRSTDDTPAILARLAREDRRLHVVAGTDLPAGWVGKPWALTQGVAHARGEWLLFTDADSVHAARGAASILWLATRAGLDAISIGTAQELGTFWERAILPSVLGMIMFVCGPLGDINDPAKPRKALANGQYLMVSRAAYDALGGHAALRDCIAEDLAFARLIKADGRFRFALVGGAQIASVRMYRSLAEIWSGFTKNVFIGGDGKIVAMAAGMAFTAALSVLPPALAVTALVRGRRLQAAEALACTATVVATTAWGMRFAGMPRRLALLAPLGMAMFAAIVANSTYRFVSGKGVDWRGRRYSGRP